jgi:hypothetical protein
MASKVFDYTSVTRQPGQDRYDLCRGIKSDATDLSGLIALLE